MMTGEMIRAFLEQWSSVTMQDESYNIVDYSDSIERFKQALRAEAVAKNDDVLPVALDFLELEANFESFVHSAGCSDPAATEIFYDEMIPDWLVSGQTKYPLLTVRKKQTLYQDLLSMKLHKKRCNRFVCLCKGKHHVTLDGLEERNNCLTNKLSGTTKEKKMEQTRVLPLLHGCKIFLDVFFEQKKSLVQEPLTPDETAPDDNLECPDTTMRSIQDPFGEKLEQPRSPYTAKDHQILKRLFELFRIGKVFEVVENRSWKRGWTLWPFLGKLQTPVKPPEKESQSRASASIQASPSQVGADYEASDSVSSEDEDQDQETSNPDVSHDDEGEDDQRDNIEGDEFKPLDEGNWFDELDDLSEPLDVHDIAACMSYLTGSEMTANSSLDDDKGEVPEEEGRVQIAKLWMQKHDVNVDFHLNITKRKEAELKKFLKSKPLDKRQEEKYVTATLQERTRMGVEFVKQIKEECSSESLCPVDPDDVEDWQEDYWELQRTSSRYENERNSLP